MAKSKVKASSAQRDRINISRAVALKKAGIISKQAKLHSGRYISKAVLRKVREFEHSADLGYRAVKVSKATAQAAKERGFQVVQGNKIIGPNSQLFRKRLQAGELTGVRPVKGGMMEEVILPHNVFDMRTLVAQLEEGIDTLKMPNEQFAFRYKGSESFRAFINTAELLKYLRHYRGAFDISGSLKTEDLQEEFDALTFFRLHPNAVDLNIRTLEQRKRDRKKQIKEKVERGEYMGQPNRYKNARAQKKDIKKSRAYREAIMADPVKAAEYKAAAAARAKASRDKGKG